jgi:hypothetical protein
VKSAIHVGSSRIEMHEVAVGEAASRQIMLALLISSRFPPDETAAAPRPAIAPGARRVHIRV